MMSDQSGMLNKRPFNSPIVKLDVEESSVCLGCWPMFAIVVPPSSLQIDFTDISVTAVVQ